MCWSRLKLLLGCGWGFAAICRLHAIIKPDIKRNSRRKPVPSRWLRRRSDLTVPPLRRVTFGSCPKSNQKVLPLACGSRCARLPSFHHCSRGTPRRAIPGPSRLSRHPCRSTPYATIPLGLLMGRLASSVRLWFKSRANLGACVSP